MSAKDAGTAAPSESAKLSGPLPGARAALALLLTINLFNYIDRQVLAAVVSNIRADFFPEGAALNDGSWAGSVVQWMQDALGFNPRNAMIGSLALAFMAAYMLLAPVFGLLAERANRWMLVAIGVILWTLATGATGMAATFGILFLTRCCVGVGEAAYGPVAPDMISDLYPAERRGSVLAWFYAAIPVGSALGYVLGGQVADLTGNWRIAFFLVVPPGLALGILSWFMPEPPRGQSDHTAARKAKWSDYLVLLKTPSYVLNTFGMTAMTFALGGIGFWMTDYIHEFRGVPEQGKVATIFGGIVVISGLAATLLGGIVGDRLRKRFSGAYLLVSGVAMLLGLPLFIAVLYVPFPLAWVFVFLACFCLFFNTGPTNTSLANVTHPSIRATAFALNILVIHALGDALSPLVIGAIADRHSLHEGFLFVSVMILLGGVFWLWGARYLDRDTALAPTRLSG